MASRLKRALPQPGTIEVFPALAAPAPAAVGAHDSQAGWWLECSMAQVEVSRTTGSPPPGCQAQPDKLRSSVEVIDPKGRYAPSGTSPGRSGPPYIT